ncbi:glycosyltransferase [bacterium]|nr:glycosyltransferase [bacterium]
MRKRRAPYLSVVVPLYNEAESLEPLHAEISGALRGLKRACEILYVDDGSTDGSFRILEKLFRRDGRVRVIQFRKNSGKSEALAAGFEAARGEAVVTLDADLQDDPAEIPRLIDRLEEGFDLVSGWKQKRRDPMLTKRLPSRFFNRITSWMTGVRLHDFNCGLKIYRREVVKSIQVYGELHRYIPVVAVWDGFSVTEIPVHHRPRRYGKTKFGASRFINGFLDLMTVLFFTKYTRRPLHFFGLIGILSGLLGGVITAYLVILRIFKSSFLSNRPLLFIGVMLVILGMQFVSIGLLGEMITRSHAEGHRHAVRSVLER